LASELKKRRVVLSRVRRARKDTLAQTSLLRPRSPQMPSHVRAMHLWPDSARSAEAAEAPRPDHQRPPPPASPPAAAVAAAHRRPSSGPGAPVSETVRVQSEPIDRWRLRPRGVAAG
jgi:hypothetical protein